MNFNITKELLDILDKNSLNIEHFFILSAYNNRQFELLENYLKFNNTKNCLLFQYLTRLNLLKVDNSEENTEFCLTEKGELLIKELENKQL